MRRLSFVPGMLLIALLVPTVASAGPITVIDPIIGVRGGMFGSEPVDSGQAISFAECPGALDSFFQCAIFSIAGTAFSAGITSITLHLVSSANPDAMLVFEQDEASPFGFEQLENGVLRFSGDGPLMCSTDIEAPSHPCGTVAGEDIAFGIKPIDETEDIFALGLTAQVIAVNDTPLNSVPEPASLLLMGTGIATLAGCRLRKKSG
jgi:hypothetical protein